MAYFISLAGGSVEHSNITCATPKKFGPCATGLDRDTSIRVCSAISDCWSVTFGEASGRMVSYYNTAGHYDSVEPTGSKFSNSLEWELLVLPHRVPGPPGAVVEDFTTLSRSIVIIVLLVLLTILALVVCVLWRNSLINVLRGPDPRSVAGYKQPEDVPPPAAAPLSNPLNAERRNSQQQLP
eukprot:NODE_4262_length_821_cov_31.739637_g3525_i0.p1 GENE.NODE_4262_length_821_cov_31.739637_g3525_i0~~NODE_4262_length_821_cov_31.739637_g3525_i0.p1  ORF type:complete len:182 (-),score=23.97 NODE_4262_length_821_cov_31.739637_g3525_i0:143-688(-)